MAVTTAPTPTAPPAVRTGPVTQYTGAGRGIESAVLPLAAAAAAAGLLAILARAASAGELARFAGLALLGLSAYALIARADRGRAGHGAAVVALPAGAVLLPLDLLVSLALVISVPRWLWPHAPRLTRAVELASEVVASIATLLTAAAVHVLAMVVLDGEAAWALAGMVACATFVGADQLSAFAGAKLEGRLSYMRPPTLSLGTKLLLAALGAAVAAVCLTNPWLAPFAVAPLLLLQQWFEIPLLEHQAMRDAKTGLFNAKYFEIAVERKLGDAKAALAPLSVLLADLDLLREINNAHGHLAGDDVLRGVGGVLQEHLRAQDVPARFGGEEFAVLLPDTTHAEAIEIAERLRSAVAATRFASGTATTELQATVSIGVASYPEHGSASLQLIHRADVAVYRAKLQGRNRVLAATDEPLTSPSSLQVVPRLRRSDAAGARRHPAHRPPFVVRDVPIRATGHAHRRRYPRSSRPPWRQPGVVSHSDARTSDRRPSHSRASPRGAGTRRTGIRRRRSRARGAAPARGGGVANGQPVARACKPLAPRALRRRYGDPLGSCRRSGPAHGRPLSSRPTLAMLLGHELGISKTELHVPSHAALFHDVGKLAVPEAILLKPEKLGDLDRALRAPRQLTAARGAVQQSPPLLALLSERSILICMARSRGFRAVTSVDPKALAEFRAGIRKRYTDDEILGQLRACAEAIGRSPTMREFEAHDGSTVHPQTVIERFGSWNRAKREAGLIPRRFATREELLLCLRALGDRIGRVPTSKDIDEHRGLVPSKSLYWHTFGSLTNALREAGFDVPVGEERLERAIEQGVVLTRELGRLPTFADWRDARRADPSLLTEWQVYRMFDARRGAWATFQYLVRERLLDGGVEVAPDGTVTA